MMVVKNNPGVKNKLIFILYCILISGCSSLHCYPTLTPPSSIIYNISNIDKSEVWLKCKSTF
jgi:hypothetical protein